MENKIRLVLNVPEDQRIGQHIYNCFRKYEQRLEVAVADKDDITTFRSIGIDIFNISDEEFINNIKKK